MAHEIASSGTGLQDPILSQLSEEGSQASRYRSLIERVHRECLPEDCTNDLQLIDMVPCAKAFFIFVSSRKFLPDASQSKYVLHIHKALTYVCSALLVSGKIGKES